MNPMGKFLFLFFILNLSVTYGQDISNDLQFIETQNTLSSPFSIPLYVNLAGEISVLTNEMGSSTSFSMQGHIDGFKNKSIYTKPLLKNEFSFSPDVESSRWIEIKRERWEVGLGIAAYLAENIISVGLVPYKGARHVMIRNKKTANEKTPRATLPDELREINSWEIGDQGSFQRFGGVQISAGLSVAGVSPLKAGIILQNLWSINISKISAEKVVLNLSEEDVLKRKVQVGLAVANAKAHFFNGKRLSARFIFNLNEPEHQLLYKEAINGKLQALQEKLTNEAQKMQWHGSERMSYIGIPGVIGKHYQRSEYDMTYEEEENVLDIRSSRNSGIFLPMRNHHKMVFQDQSSIVLFWYSEMNRADEKDLTNNFIKTGNLIGAKGFESKLSENERIGSTVAQMGLTLNRSEIEKVNPAIIDEIVLKFAQRCEEFKLKCRKQKVIDKVKQRLVDLLGKKWKEYRDQLGFLLINEPALVHAYLKVLNSRNKLYFKFLNQKYQSLEGAAPILF